MPFVYVSMPFEGDRRAALEAALPGGEFCYCPAPEVDDAALTKADVIIGNVPPAKLALAQKLRFLQLNSAGSNEYAAPGEAGAGPKAALSPAEQRRLQRVRGPRRAAGGRGAVQRQRRIRPRHL
ncbi:MAG: hypothetical protein LIO70_05545 [Clostridiales bacterium]|nr:hypothetical protein [Clostridiales bacterium]